MYVAARRVHLSYMPFDKNGRHATGDSCLLVDTEDGMSLGWWDEYVGDEYVDSPDCIEEWEDDE